ncbi:deoxyribose-phosphate aldolase [Candidatus Bathyarchaeota archaeon]|nr:deoxyribose-phosphate aldolase [Candidatus Bathyarchaeota archaeon]
MNAKKLASYIDHTLLKPQASENDISRVCREAIEYGFFSVCINPSYVSLVSNFLKNSSVKVCSVLGFPFGANTLDVKILEAKKAIQDGANEIDMVINLGAMKSGKYQQVKDEINAIVEQVKQYNNTAVKVIIETGLLNRDEKILACKIVKESKADFVKTSTGFNTSGATIADVKLLRQVVGPNFAIKASGGIRTYNNAMQLINAGANRLGTSSGVLILKEII